MRKVRCRALINVIPFLLSFVLSVSATSAYAPTSVDISTWEPQRGDRFVVDTKDNIGYIFHTDGRFISFPLVTGQRRTVHYIGLTYNAATPEGVWVARTKHVQWDRITYGSHGKFLRLYRNGDDYTHYGIHTHAYMKSFLESDNHYRSMGCIIVTDRIYEILEKTYEINKGKLNVITRYGVVHV